MRADGTITAISGKLPKIYTILGVPESSHCDHASRDFHSPSPFRKKFTPCRSPLPERIERWSARDLLRRAVRIRDAQRLWQRIAPPLVAITDIAFFSCGSLVGLY
jgi:hypothetical protein